MICWSFSGYAPGQDPYWVLPGGGVETAEDLETALVRELREEIATTAKLAGFLVSHLGVGIDLFALADLRTGLVSGTEPAVSDSGAGLKPTYR
jgi:8-oxo-dGTP pyrophosphatase MutT (NUDIX family)